MRQTHIFIDESGDIGYPRGSSILTIAALITWNKKRIERIPLQIRKKRLRKSVIRKSELKFHNCDERVRRAVLSLLMKHDDFQIMAIVVDKKVVAKELWEDKEGFYDECCAQLVAEVVKAYPNTAGLNIVFDQRYKSKGVNDIFTSRIRTRIIEVCPKLEKAVPLIQISGFDSQRSRGLQVADFVAGAIQRRYEQNDSTYYEIIATRIMNEDRLPSS